jgi:hypothetical protein
MKPQDLDPATEERWCAERRDQVIAYLRTEGIDHGRVGEWPAWHVSPVVSLWAIESRERPGSVGWWVICGDLPTDYVTGSGVPHPRVALLAIAERWLEMAACMAAGRPHPTMDLGAPADWPELAPLLEARAKLLRKFSQDDRVWADLEP